MAKQRYDLPYLGPNSDDSDINPSLARGSKRPVFVHDEPGAGGREVGYVYRSDTGFFWAYTRNHEQWSGPFYDENTAAADLKMAAKRGKL